MPTPSNETATTMLDRRVVLIGTPESLAGLAAQLAPVPTSEAEVLGTVVLSPADAAAASALPLPLLGSVDDLPRLHARFGFRSAIVSIPSVMSAAAARVRSALAALNVAERNSPAIHDVLRGAANASSNGHDTGAMRALLAPGAGIDFAALIGRASRRLNEPAARAVLGGKRLLITGAGGSIGSELARLCAALEPSCLILMDRAENPLFEIDREIKARFPHVSRQTVLHDVVDAEATLRRLVALRPDVVFHAAAHKHVPMMEDHPGAAITNNLFGTKSIADAALAVGAERFVMVSTDKAVHPTSVMGATKRLAELYIRSLNRSRGGGRAVGGTKFSLVRFGNVLGSACSVLPIWARQIAEGGPVTVTDPRMTRYFMTIPEAATLVIHAGTLARGDANRGAGDREVFVLDMGEPIKILDLADRFVRSMGLSPRFPVSLGRSEAAPGPAIRIAVTGARPGEKLHEELAYPAEELSPTEADGVMAWSGDDRDEIDPGFITRMISELSAVRAAQDAVVVQRVIANYVQTLNRSSTDATFQTVAA